MEIDRKNLLPDELALLELSRKATPGLVECSYPRGDDFRAVRIFAGATYLASVCNSDMNEEEIKNNAELFAESRNMVEPLLQRLAESRAEVRRLNHIIKCVNKHLDKDVPEIVEESEADHAD